MYYITVKNVTLLNNKGQQLTHSSKYQLQARNTLHQVATLVADTTELSLCWYTDAGTQPTLTA